MSRTAFVTGGTGFVGLNLVQRLMAGDWDVTALHRASSPAPNQASSTAAPLVTHRDLGAIGSAAALPQAAFGAASGAASTTVAPTNLGAQALLPQASPTPPVSSPPAAVTVPARCTAAAAATGGGAAVAASTAVFEGVPAFVIQIGRGTVVVVARDDCRILTSWTG